MPRRLFLIAIAVAMLCLNFVLQAPVQAADATADSLFATVAEARLAGDHARALVTAERLKAHLGHDNDAQPWQIADAERLLFTLTHALALSDSSRNRLVEAHALGGLILDQYREGDFTGALNTADRQLDIRNTLLPADHEDIAESMRRRGVLHLQLGRYAAAATDTRDALAMLRLVLPPDHPSIAKALHNLATVSRLMGDHGGAEPLYREALAMRRRVLDPDHMDIVWSLNNLAIFLSVKGEFDEAETLFQQVLDLQRQRLGEDDPNLALVMHNLANARLDAGHAAEAVPVFREALAITRRHHGEENRYVAGILHGLGTALRDESRRTEADSLLADALGLYKRLFGNDHPHVAEVLADRGLLYWSSGDSSMAESYLEQAVATYERARLIVGGGYERSAFQDSPADDLAAVKLLRGRGDDAWYAAERALGRSLADLLAVSDADSTTVSALPESLEIIQTSLAEDTAIVGWLTVELVRDVPRSWSYVIRHRGPVRWKALDIDAEMLRRSEDLGRLLAQSGAWPFSIRDTSRLDDLTWFVAANWIHPSLEDLDGVRRLIALPSGPLLGVPLSALPATNGGTLDESFAISYAPSASIHARLERRARYPSLMQGGALLVGDPPVSGESLTPLPGARGEVQELADVFPTATILLGSDARETTLERMSREGELASYRWLHLATHALVDEAHPDRSSLVLAGRGGVPAPAVPDAQPVPGDGLLTASEIVQNWRLNADLVTLSGCRTALGRPSPGEGYIGLAHAFLRAGARSLLVSLWPVDDDATRLLMEHFYGILLGGDHVEPAEALRQSQMWLREWLNEKGETPYGHPAYWSAFVLIGS